MEGTMKAAVLVKPGELEIQEVPIPKIGPNDILFKVSYASVCGSDLHAIDEGIGVQHYPITIGHEFTGYVVEVGEEVKDITVGMRFMGTNIQWCGECEYCKSGNFFSCEDVTKKGLGFGVNGVFAEYSVLHNPMINVSVYPLPDEINDMMGATCEPMCVGVGCVDQLDVHDGDKIVIYGAGIIGQSFIQALKAQYDVEIAVVNRAQFRLDLAKLSGADHIISPTKEKPAIETIRELWGTGRYTYHYDNSTSGNADIVIDCTGNPNVIAECFHTVKQFGQVCLAAACADGVTAPIEPADLFFKGIKYVPGLMGNFAKSVEYMADGRYKTEHLITQVYPLEKIKDAIAMARDTKHSCKVSVKVDPNAPNYPYNKQE